MTTLFSTMAAVRAANKAAGHHFFDRDTLRFFGSKIECKLYAGRYFVTSEQPPHGPRVWRVREAQPDGTIDTVGEQLATLADAQAAIKTLTAA